MMTKYQIIRSSRKTLAMQLKEDGSLIIRAPYRVSQKQIEKFVQEHQGWIEKARLRIGIRKENRLTVTEEERSAGIKKALQIIPERVGYFSKRMNVTYGRITIREQKTRWGSCSSAGNLNFNWKLVLLPAPLLDYVIVHELAHRKEMNHSPRFWSVVEQEMPDYARYRRQLNEYSL